MLENSMNMTKMIQKQAENKIKMCKFEGWDRKRNSLKKGKFS